MVAPGVTAPTSVDHPAIVVAPGGVAAPMVAAHVVLLVALHVATPMELPLTYPQHVVALDLPWNKTPPSLEFTPSGSPCWTSSTTGFIVSRTEEHRHGKGLSRKNYLPPSKSDPSSSSDSSSRTSTKSKYFKTLFTYLSTAIA